MTSNVMFLFIVSSLLLCWGDSFLKSINISKFLHFVIRIASKNISINLSISLSDVNKLLPIVLKSKLLSNWLNNAKMFLKKIDSECSNFFRIAFLNIIILWLTHFIVILNENSNLRISIAKHTSIIDIGTSHYHFLIIHYHQFRVYVKNLCNWDLIDESVLTKTKKFYVVLYLILFHISVQQLWV